jgi:hypothetical protein
MGRKTTACFVSYRQDDTDEQATAIRKLARIYPTRLWPIQSGVRGS